MLSQDELREAAQIRATMEAKLARIQASGDLVPRAAARERARCILVAREAMQALRARSDERTSAEAAKAYRAAFGIRPERSAEDRSYRDSLTARNVGWEEAAQLFAQAQARGDELAQTALAEYAWQRHDDPLGGKAWLDSILVPYGASKPAYDAALTTLSDAVEPDRMGQLRDKVATEIAQPPDLHGDLRSLAADEGEAS
jgi:hypothetical protein